MHDDLSLPSARPASANTTNTEDRPTRRQSIDASPSNPDEVARERAEAVAKPRTWRFFWLTLLVLGLVSTAAQAIVAGYMGVLDLFEWRLTPGGLVVVGAAAHMRFRCVGWDDWKRRIWVWVAVTAGLAGLAMYANVLQDGLAPVNSGSASSEAPRDSSSDPSSESSSATPTESEGGTTSDASVESEGSPDRSVEERAEAAWDMYYTLDKAAFVDVFRAARESGMTYGEIRQSLVEDYEAGNMPQEQYCLLDQYVVELKRNIQYSEYDLIAECVQGSAVLKLGGFMRQSSYDSPNVWSPQDPA